MGAALPALQHSIPCSSPSHGITDEAGGTDWCPKNAQAMLGAQGVFPDWEKSPCPAVPRGTPPAAQGHGELVSGESYSTLNSCQQLMVAA